MKTTNSLRVRASRFFNDRYTERPGNLIEVVAFACRGTLLDWTRAVDAVAYELARRNGESPLDRGAALGRRAEARPLPGACEAVALATASGRRVLAVSRGERPEALGRFGGAFDEVVSDPGEIDADPEAILYVSSARHRRAEVRDAGMHAVAPRALGQAFAVYSVPATLSVP